MSLGPFHPGRLDFPFLGCCVVYVLGNIEICWSTVVPLIAYSQRSQVWRPPDSGFKVNVDAALDKSKGIFSLGVVARDWLGTLLWAGAKCFKGSIEAETAETWLS
ncbi:hypothetical protein Q3G72_010043 [Acer saccharum]|nr:hypothetical protein Q3G72_010043 [Acer saccharum]